ncbi:MAG: DUF6290 family protein [Verrucomicrobiota bacterium]|nr:DUF6290 family protein [Verrucomicrobiota bacterium]
MTTNKDYSMSLRLPQDEANRIRKIISFTGQSISDFIRMSVRSRIEAEELRIMQHEAEKLELQRRLGQRGSRKKL